MIVEYNKMKDGTNDVARYLGLNPEKTIFLHSTSFNENDEDNIKRKAINKGRMIYSEILSYSSNIQNGSKSAISYFNEQLIEEMEKMQVLRKDNIIKVTDSNNLDYPYNSVSTMLNRRVKQDKNFRDAIEGFNIVSSYISKEDEDTARLINGKLLMDRKQQEKFNSKYEFRKMSEKYGFKVPKGIAIKGLNNLNQKLQELKNDSSNYTTIWIKLESQSSGKGNIRIENFNTVSVKEIEEMVLAVSKQIYNDDYIYKDMPFIAEYDVSSANEEEVANIGVEAVIAENKVTILGGVEQATKDGEYIGSKLTPSTYNYLEIAQSTAEEAFIAVSKEGYRGFMTIDVLVTKNKETSEVSAYNIDPNARFSAGTMLLKNIHTAEYYHKKRMYGLSFSNAIPEKDNMIASIIDWLGEDLYNKKGDYTGIIPALINDINPIDGNKYYLKSVVVYSSYEEVQEKFNKFKDRIKAEL